MANVCEKPKWEPNTIWRKKYTITKGILDIDYSIYFSVMDTISTSWVGVFNYDNGEDCLAFTFDRVKQLVFETPDLLEVIKNNIEKPKLESILKELTEIEKESYKKIMEAMRNIKILGSDNC